MADGKETGNYDFIYGPIKELMRETIGAVAFTTYIDNLVPVNVEGRYIFLESPSETLAGYIMENLGDKIRECIIKADVGPSDFRLLIKSDDGKVTSMDAKDEIPERPNLDPKFTFDSYVVGKNNEFVYAAAVSVAEEPGLNYNPLFIYGGTGLGKTHLMQAIAHKISDDNPSFKIIYVTCEQFTNEIIDSMFLGRGSEARERGAKIRQKYRSADILLIDDIQFIQNKKAVQEEFFHTFNELVSHGKQIVITSDRPPKELTDLEDRLRTRFAGGLLADITPPSYETKIAILRRKALDKRAIVPDSVLEFLANDSGDDVRALEGRLTKVIFAAKLHEVPISIELAEDALSEAVRGEDDNSQITPADVINSVSAYYKVDKKDIVGKSKKKEVALPRQVCCYLMCDLLSLPLIAVGKSLGGRDHTTILYSRNRIEEMLKVNDKIAKDVDDIKNMVLKK
ncbi:MAG: chromosomal replication initiator protein DnaA [Clostridia bacterium]|nr:chromosomal replication initiator protein DnaA [Clostridia bacterium]